MDTLLKAFFLLWIAISSCECETILQHPEMEFGTLFDWEYCENGSYGNAFEIKRDRAGVALRDDEGMTGIRIYCENLYDEKTNKITSYDRKKGSWQGPNYCKEGSWLSGFRIRIEGFRGWLKDDTGANDIEMRCTLGETHKGGGTDRGNWKNWQECPEGEAICGVRTRVETDGVVDNMGLVAVRLKCCQLQEPTTSSTPTTTTTTTTTTTFTKPPSTTSTPTLSPITTTAESLRTTAFFGPLSDTPRTGTESSSIARTSSPSSEDFTVETTSPENGGTSSSPGSQDLSLPETTLPSNKETPDAKSDREGSNTIVFPSTVSSGSFFTVTDSTTTSASANPE